MQDENRENPFFEDDENRVEEEESTQESKDAEAEKQKKNSISSDLIRGHINTIILRSLYEGDRYGYDIINEIEQKSHGQYTLKQPTLYSALKRLETQGYIKSYWGGVSNGGRRRYFSLTDEGRAVAEKNQAEWEYSRTIIDSLISENDFDFSNPAPEKLDFRILRQATSRTPIVSEEEEAAYYNGTFNTPSYTYTEPTKEPDKAEEAQPVTQISPAPAPTTSEPIRAEEEEKESTAFFKEQVIEESVSTYESATPPSAPIEENKIQSQEKDPEQEQKQAQEQTLGHTIPLFITRTEEERNYKDIVTRIYRSGIKPERLAIEEETEQETQYESAPNQVSAEEYTKEPERTPQPSHQTETNAVNSESYEHIATTEPVQGEPAVRYSDSENKEEQAPLYSGKISFQDIEESAHYDGLRVWTAGGARQKKAMPEDFFNKGLALFRAALTFFIFAIAETVLAVIFRENFELELYYLVTAAVVAILPLIVCTILYLAKYQPCRKRLKHSSAIYNGIITFISIFILLVAVVLIMNVDLTNPTLLIKYVVLPLVYLFNINIFAITYYFLSRSKL